MPRNNRGVPCGTGGHPINLGNKQMVWSNLNLLVVMFRLSRQTIKNEFAKNKIRLGDYEDVAFYIKQKLGKQKK